MFYTGVLTLEQKYKNKNLETCVLSVKCTTYRIRPRYVEPEKQYNNENIFILFFLQIRDYMNTLNLQ